MIREMFSSNKSVSSKRIIDAFCIFIYIGLLISTFIGLKLSDNQVIILTNLLYAGAGLLGIGTFENMKLK